MEANICEQDTQHGRYLTFTVGKESFGLEIANVREIVGLQPITPLPEAEGGVKGIINLRGKIIPVIDMYQRFGESRIVYDDRTCIVVVDIKGVSVGLIVDTVSEVLTIEDESIVPPPVSITGTKNHYIKAIGKVGGDIKLLLECTMLVRSDETETNMITEEQL